MDFHLIFQWFIRNLYFSRITVTGSGHVPEEGPVLALCLHRNGAVDGYVYRAAVSHLTFLVRAKLRKGLIGKLFFPGMDVTRQGDGGRPEDLLQMITDCAHALSAGTSLAIFPEGTSKLGPRHLPFKSGAARIAQSHQEGNGGPLTILPLGIHYECPWAFRSRVEVVVGAPVSLPPASSESSKAAHLREIKHRFTTALEDVGINVPDEETQDLLQKFAYVATLGTDHRYFAALKAMEEQLPPELFSAWRDLEAETKGRRLLRHQGVPLFPYRFPWLYALAALLLGVPLLAGAVLNLPPLAVAWFAGRRFADDTNVITLWRVITGIPVLIIWALAWLVVPICLGMAWLFPLYLILTFTVCFSWYRFKKLAVAAWNGISHPALGARAHAFHQLVLQHLEQPEDKQQHQA